MKAANSHNPSVTCFVEGDGVDGQSWVAKCLTEKGCGVSIWILCSNSVLSHTPQPPPPTTSIRELNGYLTRFDVISTRFAPHSKVSSATILVADKVFHVVCVSQQCMRNPSFTRRDWKPSRSHLSECRSRTTICAEREAPEVFQGFRRRLR